MTDLPIRIGPYTVLAPLGVGGMAETFVALRRGPGAFEQRVCLKRVRADLGHDPEFVRQFMAEAAIVAKLGHSAIAQVLDFGRDGRDYYMALELVDGLDLRQLLDAGEHGLPFEQALYVAIEIASALDFAHRGGGMRGASPVVHRDVSASNVLLSREGAVKLGDFGIARALSGPQHTRTGIVKGKVPYMAPEYARSGRFDLRCDLFSLGVLLYECACGERPHAGATDLETLELAASASHLPLHERARDVPEAFASLVERLLAPDPDARYAKTAAVLEALVALPGSSPRARRELGVRVSEIRSTRASERVPERSPLAMSATERADAELGASDTPPTQVMATPTPQVGNLSLSDEIAGMRPRGPVLALGLALSLAAAVSIFGLLRTQAAPAARTPEPASTVVVPALAPVAASTRPLADTQAAERPTTPDTLVLRPSNSEANAPDRRPKSRRSTLELVVLPYGELVVDGKAIGKAPATLALEPGKHAIEAKTQAGVIRQSVSLAAGEHRQLVLR